MSKTLVVTGTRVVRPDADFQFEWFCKNHFMPTHVILGCATGVDTQARVFFTKLGLQPKIFRAVWRKNNVYNHYAGHDRNQRMIDAAPDSAHLIVLPLWLGDRPLWSKCPGTEDCYKRGRARGLQCHLL